MTVYISAKATCTPMRRASMAVYSLDARLRRAQLRHDARIEQPRHIEIAVVEILQLDDGRDVIGVRQQHELRLLVADGRQRLARRQREGLVGLHIGARDDIEILIEHDDGAEAAHGGLEGQELLEACRGSASNTAFERDSSMATTRMSERTIWAWSLR